MLKETLGHTRMLQWTLVGAAHWFVFVGFGLLFFTLLTAFGQLFDAHFALPLIGHFFLYEWVSEFFTVVMLVAIVAFIGYRATRPKERTRGAKGRFFGSTMWQGYFVEIGHPRRRPLHRRSLRGAGVRPAAQTAASTPTTPPPSLPVLVLARRGVLRACRAGSSRTSIYLVAMVKILISFTWMIVISLNPTMGVAWHRFTAFFNIWFKREADGGTALGGLQPIMVDGQPIDFENIDDLDEDARARRRQGRGLRLEGHPRLHLVHRVRPLPEPVPGLEHREAALPQAADHRPA